MPGVYTLTLDGIQLQALARPQPLPCPIQPSRLAIFWGKVGAGGPGCRLIRRLGSHTSHWDYKFRTGYFTPDQVAQLTTKNLNQTVMDLVVEATTHKVIFAENGWQPFLSKYVVYSEFYGADVHVHVLAQ